ncbi:hypothetical protein LNP74_33515 [Klebsiella pneumoniae subsp. pneumoniae]|nr:hypothetical protein [Klebsiella pneumoniae subsp. pneumoniae]
MNFGIRGLNPRLASRSTVLMDGIPVPLPPAGQPQLSHWLPFQARQHGCHWTWCAVVGAVRYGPQSVGGVDELLLPRAIPVDFGIEAGWKVSSAQPLHKTTRKRRTQPDGGRHSGQRFWHRAALYSGTRGSD